MKPLTIDSFKCEKIRAVSSDQKSVDDFNYTSVRFEYNGDRLPSLRINGTFRIFKFNPIQYGLFLKHYSMGGAIMPPL